MNDTQELPHHGHERPHFQHASDKAFPKVESRLVPRRKRS
jgi:hypothetical protein